MSYQLNAPSMTVQQPNIGLVQQTAGYVQPAVNYVQQGYVQPAVNYVQPAYQQSQVIVQQPGMQGVRQVAGQIQNVRQWSTGVFGCCEDIKDCCFAFWCFPCYTCSLANKMDECTIGPCCCGACGKICGLHLPGTPNIFLTSMRTKMRSKYGIQGSICDDVCCMCWCEFCVTTQMSRELKHQGVGFL